MNGINLERFRFEYDLTWMAFFQNAKGQTYTRYGGRDDSNAETFLTKQSLVSVMKRVLQLHESGSVQPTSIYEPEVTGVTTPKDVPTLKKMMLKRKDSSCIHCHDIKNSQLRHLHDTGELKKKMVFTYPSPGLLGLHLDPDRQNSVASVEPDSAADKAGIQVGDFVESSDGYRILTFADMTRVLELAPAEGSLPLVINRDNKSKSFSIDLPADWKHSDDPSWRPSVGTVGPGGGFWGKSANANLRTKLKLKPTDLAIRVTFIWAPHAKAAGVKMNDVVVAIEDQAREMTMRQFLSWLQINRNWGDTVTLTVLRRGKRVKLQMTLPDGPQD